MSQPTRVALLGFSPVERATFESVFRRSAERPPGYVAAASLAEAHFIVADADDAAACAEVGRHGLIARTVVLGSTPHPGALLQLPVPIDPRLVVRALDQLPRGGAARAAAASGVDDAEPSPHVQRVLEELAHQTRPMDLDVDVRVDAAAAAGASADFAATTPESFEPFETFETFAPLDQHPAPHPPAAPTAESTATAAARLDHILLVDDSDIALRFMVSTLQRFGFQIHLARSGAEAIERVRTRDFEFVFIDVEMAGLDGIQTCKAIKRADYPAGRRPPAIVMLCRHATPADTLRCTMAGADAWLTTPLRKAELLKVIGEREVQGHAYVDTADATTLS